MKNILLPFTLFVAATAAHAGSNVAAASDPGALQAQSSATTNLLLTSVLQTDQMILAALNRIEASHAAAPDAPFPGARPPLESHGPAVVYNLTGATGEPWAPEGVWADETGIHVRFKMLPKTMAQMPDSITAKQPDGTYQVVGLRFWPMGIVDVETRASTVLFSKDGKDVIASAIKH
ncbi:exported hypothetical protein [Paraburkholderia tropica]|uniref:hypothetical protein n=1 Tax=Paraburkholderia tropica TaxID=92647 RepID=UPI001CAE8A84|nr:hypothetical protein [Paraburkholderia tropica]CAG9230128.1 exported hypothetical protein [Paraburkholderia tropica]